MLLCNKTVPSTIHVPFCVTCASLPHSPYHCITILTLFSHSILPFPGSDADPGEPSANSGDMWRSERRRLQENLLQELPEDGGEMSSERPGEEVTEGGRDKEGEGESGKEKEGMEGG